jgi:hypothetical protein
MCPSVENGDSQTNVDNGHTNGVNGTNGSELALKSATKLHLSVSDNTVQIMLATLAFTPGSTRVLNHGTHTSPSVTTSAMFLDFKSSRARCEKENSLPMRFSILQRRLK